MDNKKPQQNFTRPSNSSKACQSADSNRKSTDLQSNKPWPRNSRRREQPIPPRNEQQRNCKQFASTKRPNVDKRPRPRGGGGTNNGSGAAACTSEDVSAAGTGLVPASEVAHGTTAGAQNGQNLDYELNSVYAPGSKKQNLNHLLNFHYAPRESDYALGSLSVFGRGGGGGGAGGGHVHRNNQGGAGGGRKYKYNKEQFLQANFQFVIKSSATPKFTASPDALMDWDLIEQINIQTTEEPQCPICLYPPIAAKLTRCGHVYCWPCILHYLALNDKTWRKCPICYEAIHTADLRSCSIVQQQPIKVGTEITFQLMRRKKGSMFIEPHNSKQNTMERYPLVSGDAETKLYSKFLVARRADILDIIERERRELITDEDPSCPEFVFIQQALDLLKERHDKLSGDLDIKEEILEMEKKEAIEVDKNEEKEAIEVEMKEITEGRREAIGDHENISPEAEVTDAGDERAVAGVDESTAAAELKEAIATAATAKYYYFYQSVDGQNIYLHPLNVKMLQACYGTLDRSPLVICATILQQEHHSMNEEHRRKFTCLGHLPLTCQFAVVEVDLEPPVITGGILRLFKDDILFRKKERQRRDREERKREKKIDEINDRQMGKLIASTANLNLGSSHEFPTCGFEEFLLSPSPSSSDGAHFISAAAAVAVPRQHASYSTVAVVGEAPSSNKAENWPTLASPPSNNYNNSFQELSVWGNRSHAAVTAASAARRAASDRSSECDSIVDVDAENVPTRTMLSDVLAEAISQQKQNKSGNGSATAAGGNKKNKKSKKMLPLFSTGMNYNGN